MSHVPTVPEGGLHIYQGEDWAIDITLSGADAPATVAGWIVRMDIRVAAGSALVRRLTLGSGFTILDAPDVGWRAELMRSVTLGLAPRVYEADLFVDDDQGKAWPLFRTPVLVERRVTKLEASD